MPQGQRREDIVPSRSQPAVRKACKELGWKLVEHDPPGVRHQRMYQVRGRCDRSRYIGAFSAYIDGYTDRMRESAPAPGRSYDDDYVEALGEEIKALREERDNLISDVDGLARHIARRVR